MKGILAFFLIVLLIFCISNFGLVYKRSQKHTEKHIEVDMTNSDTATADKADNDDHPVMDETPRRSWSPALDRYQSKRACSSCLSIRLCSGSSSLGVSSM